MHHLSDDWIFLWLIRTDPLDDHHLQKEFVGFAIFSQHINTIPICL